MASSSSGGLAVTFCGDDACGQQVEAGRSDVRYCSNACRQRSYRRRKRLLAPYGGDVERALAERTAKMLAVTASTGTSRNAKEADVNRAFADVLAKMLAVTASTRHQP